MITTFLFDLDGTLIDTPKIIMNGYIKTLKVHVPSYTPTDDEVTEILGMTLRNAFSKHTKDEEHFLKIVESFRKFTHEETLKELNEYKNAKNTIQYLKSKNYKVGIVTSKVLFVVLENLKQVKMENLFDCIVTSDLTKQHKPNPEPLLLALSKLDSSVEEAIYIGDHENDIKAANNANMKSGLVGYSNRYNQSIKENPTYIFNDLEEIKKHF